MTPSAKRQRYRTDPDFRATVIARAKKRHERLKTDPVYRKLVATRKDIYRVRESYNARLAHAERLYKRYAEVADACREALVRCYGQERGNRVRCAESIMISQYGRGLRDEDWPIYFPFLAQ